MCRECGHTNTTKHLLYWQAEWFKRFFRTWYHIFNRKAYHKFLASKHMDKVFKVLNSNMHEDGQRMELDSLLK